MTKKDQESKQEINMGNVSEDDKNKKREYGKNRYHNMSEEKKQTKRISRKLLQGKKVSIIMNEVVF